MYIPQDFWNALLHLNIFYTGNCDNCVRPGGVQLRNLAEEAHLLLTAVKSCGGKFGLGLPIDVLRGSLVCISKFWWSDPI